MQGARTSLRYLHVTSKLKIVYRKREKPILLGECDADWSGDKNDRKSITRFCFKNGQHSGAISWQVKKRQIIAVSTCEGLTAAAQEAIFF